MSRGRWPSIGVCTILAAASLACAGPLLAHRALPDASDVSFHALCARSFFDALREGIVYPRWVGDANIGFGGPTFVVYPPLGYYATAAVAAVTGSITDAMRWVLVAATFASAVTFFVAARDVASDLAAAVGAAFYVLLPYHVLDLYERFAFGEYLAFVWLPLAVLGIRRLGERFSWGAWFTLAIAAAGLVLTHALTALMAALVLGPYAVAVAWRSGRWRALAEMAAAGALAIACSGAYVVPMLVERGETNYAVQLAAQFDWRRNLAFWDETVLGFDHDAIGPWVDSGALVTLLLAVFAALPIVRRSREALVGAAFAFGVFLIQTPLAAPLWAFVPGLAVIQFPWRFGAFATLFGALLAAMALSSARRRTVLLPLVLVAVAALGLSLSISGLEKFRFDDAEAATVGRRHRFFWEHFPKGVDLGPWYERGYSDELIYLDGDGSYTVLAWTSEARRVQVELPESGRVVLRTFAFPGWGARIDGSPVAIRPDDRFHAIALDVPAGAHEIEAVYAPTWDRKIGAATSAVGLLVAALLAILGIRGSSRIEEISEAA